VDTGVISKDDVGCCYDNGCHSVARYVFAIVMAPTILCEAKVIHYV
jgi:hypothetical protein